MTEQEWLTSTDPAKMVRFVTENPDHENINCTSERKLRLWCAAAAISFGGSHVSSWVASNWSNGEADDIEVQEVSFWCNHWATMRRGRQEPDPFAVTAADLLRHIVGNPFRGPGLTRACTLCPGDGLLDDGNNYGPGLTGCHVCSGKGWLPVDQPPYSTPVLSLASALYDGEDCYYALADALIEMGGVDEMAEHFAGEPSHPKGCAWLDLILGKE